MATISDIKNVLKHAKHGQFVELSCNGISTDFDATVIQLGTGAIQTVKAEDWTPGWPEYVTYDTISCGNAYILNTLSVNC